MARSTSIHIGTGGWSYDHWIRRFYPGSLNRRQWLSYYTSRFDSVELNMSFYGFQVPAGRLRPPDQGVL
jgi:uncharacterized protein YecE (DUF72 family)